MRTIKKGRIKCWFWRFNDVIQVLPIIHLRVEIGRDHIDPVISLGIEWILWTASIDYYYKKETHK